MRTAILISSLVFISSACTAKEEMQRAIRTATNALEIVKPLLEQCDHETQEGCEVADPPEKQEKRE